MISIDVHFGPGAWPDLTDKPAIHLPDTFSVAVLDAGMTNGEPSVALRYDLPDGTPAIAETSARLFCMAAKMIMAKYPKLFEDG